MSDNVVALRPTDPPARAPDPYAELQRIRTQMIGAWTAWLATRPDSVDIMQEIHGTTVAMRSLADLMAVPTGRGG